MIFINIPCEDIEFQTSLYTVHTYVRTAVDRYHTIGVHQHSLRRYGVSNIFVPGMYVGTYVRTYLPPLTHQRQYSRYHTFGVHKKM